VRQTLPKSRAKLLLGLLISFPLVIGDSLAQTSPATIEQVSLQLRWYHQFQFAGYYVANTLGFYREAGLSVTIRPGAPGLSPIDEVVEGRADFGIASSGLLKAREQNKPVKALASIFQKSPMRLIIMSDSDIQSIHHLRDRKVMLSPGYSSLALIAMLYQVGLLDQIDRIDSSHNVKDLINGNTDAFNGYVSNEPYLLESQGVPHRMFDPANYGIQFYSDILFANESLTQRDPEMVRAFIEASIRGWQYALDNPEQAITITRQYAPNKALGHLRYEANLVTEQIMPDLVELGHMSPLRWEKIQQQLVGIGLMKSKVDIDKFLFPRNAATISWSYYRNYFMGVAGIILLLIGFAIFNAMRSHRLQQQVEKSQQAQLQAYQLATHDVLTGLPNRLLLNDRLKGTIERSQRDKAVFMISFIDLDNFKLANDEFSHQEGDKLLVEITREIEQVKRDADTLARFGGDEFIMISENIKASEAQLVAKRILQAIRQAGAKLETSVPISASIGIVVVELADEISIDKLLKLADLVMYEVKSSGKDNILVKRYRGGTALDDYQTT
jgi:diguanylate cyclase (GGDEF)-like protein